MTIILYVLAAIGIIGVVDVTFLRGQLGVELSAFLPWTRK